MNCVATTNDAITLKKKNKLIDIYYELITIKLYHLRIESDYEKRGKIQEEIIEMIELLEQV